MRVNWDPSAHLRLWTLARSIAPDTVLPGLGQPMDLPYLPPSPAFDTMTEMLKATDAWLDIAS